MSSIFADQQRPRNTSNESKCGGRGGVAGSQPMSTAVHVTWSPNKLWRSASIFNLCFLPILGIPVAFILAQVEKAWDSPLGILCSLGTSGGYAAFLAVGLAVAAAVAVAAFLFLLPCLGPPWKLFLMKTKFFFLRRNYVSYSTYCELQSVQSGMERTSLKGHGNEPDFPRFLH